LTGTFNTELQTWTLQDEFNGDKKIDGSSYHSFSMNALNQIELQTKNIPGTIEASKSAISWSAKTELISLT
jgi:hypothetical protein